MGGLFTIMCAVIAAVMMPKQTDTTLRMKIGLQRFWGVDKANNMSRRGMSIEPNTVELRRKGNDERMPRAYPSIIWATRAGGRGSDEDMRVRRGVAGLSYIYSFP
jgi:hypothetical protein